nr:rna polymerase i-specific transcription initiation factor rrn11 [Quercus suber]
MASLRKESNAVGSNVEVEIGAAGLRSGSGGGRGRRCQTPEKMAIYAPFYRVSQGHHRPKRRRSTDRGEDDDNDNDDENVNNNETHGGFGRGTVSSGAKSPDSSGFHPVNRTDPYHVAGYPRDKSSLPPPPFPHAAVTSSSGASQPQAGDLVTPSLSSQNAEAANPSSLKRRHVDNLTTILHTCMLRQDWDRASRAWALLLRTEIEGRGLDVRRHERWKVGAELLMRRSHHENGARVAAHPSSNREESIDSSTPGTETAFVNPVISEYGFQLARQYYERLILQYPHTARGQTLPTSLIFYPALFNIWVYEVQARARREEDLEAAEPELGSATRARELAEATLIAERMDELLATPDFDISAPLLQLRGMVGLWLSDLLSESGDPSAERDDDDGDSMRPVTRGQTAEAHEKARKEKVKAARCFSKAKAAGAMLPASAESLIARMSIEALQQ